MKALMKKLPCQLALGTATVMGASLASANMVLEEIVVTAQKREQNLQDVAGAITAFGATTIKERGLDAIENLAISTPGFTYREATGTGQMSIRGVGMLVVTGVAEPNVATHVDGVFQPRSGSASVQFDDLERVEVLRGPQGTLYGRNATGGTVNFISAKPSDELEGRLTVGVGRFDELKLNGLISGPIVEGKVNGRLSAFWSERDGYYENIFLNQDDMGRDTFGVRAALQFTPSDELTIDVSAAYNKEEVQGPIQALLRGTNPILDTLGLTGSPTVAQTTEAHKHADEITPNIEPENTSVTLEVNYDISDQVSLKSITGYIDHDSSDIVFGADGTSFGIVGVGLEPDDRRFVRSETISQEFNLSGLAFDDRLQWMLGLFYFEDDHNARSPFAFPDPVAQPFFGGISGGAFELQEDTVSKAIFTDLTYSITDNFRLGAGLRYTDDSKEYSQTNAVFLGALSIPLCENLETEADFDGVTGRVRAEYDAREDAMLYAQVQTGFKDGGIDLSTCADGFEEEDITAYEIGAKTAWMDGSLVLNLSAFYYDYENLQIQQFLQGATAEVNNVPESTMYGGEIELISRPVDGLTLDLGVSLLNAEVDEFLHADQANPAAGIQDLSGQELQQSPGYTVNFGAEYEWDTDMGGLRLRGEVFTTDEYDFREFGNEIDLQESYTLVNLYATYTSPSDSYSVRAFVKNATDEEYLSFLIYTSGSGVQGSYAEPMTWGLEFTANF